MGENVQVIVRCRPLNEREIQANVDEVVSVDPLDQTIALRKTGIHANNPHIIYTFDNVFDTNATNEEIYNEAVLPLVDSVLLGYNGCVFAYGQTSCGKTFSMQGISQPSSQQGIMSRAFDHIFESIREIDVNYFVVKASYLEIYNEEIRDLLHRHDGYKLEVKEHPEKGVYVKDLTSVDVTCVEELEEVLEVGSWHRVLGATAQNPDSSRSHCIFTVEFELSFEEDGEEQYRSGRLNLVDLAGSERQSYSRAVGERFKEATKINLSLSALGNVISALVNEKSKHIPYRASKLTRLLQDSLGGNSRTLMIACVSPGENNYGETMSTLRYANRAKDIKNRPRMNEDPKDALINHYQREIKMLRQLLSSQITMDDGSSLLGLPSFGNEVEDDGKFISSNTKTPQILSKRERLHYESTISTLRQKYDSEHTSREKVETNFQTLQSDYHNYRLKHEYKVHKLQMDHKQKMKRMQEQLKDNESDESAYISANSDENLSSDAENLSCDSFTFKKDKSTDLSPLAVDDNSHLWSYQWLKCYCDTYKKSMSKSVFSLNQDFNKEFHCICTEQIKQNRLNEKGSQTCQICIRRAKLIMGEELDDEDTTITSQPDLSSQCESIDEKEQVSEEIMSTLCCMRYYFSFFGEKKT